MQRVSDFFFKLPHAGVGRQIKPYAHAGYVLSLSHTLIKKTSDTTASASRG